MDTISLISKSSYNTSILSEDSFENDDKNILAKFKRLQIEENHIRHSLRKSFNPNYISHNADNLSEVLEYQKFRKNLTDSYRNVKNLFEYVKANTSNPESLKSIDIDEIKMVTLELEEKMKTLKKSLQSELSNLEREEKDLNKNINENPAKIYKIKKRPNLHSVSYNEIVPSPVKEIINSSFKCVEVQQFQDFMASSGSRYGGWNEYYHNIFTRSWTKYIQVNCNVDVESYIKSVMNSAAFQSLLNDLLTKLPAFKIDDIISHSQWYLKYIYLKERQKVAIEKWRENRKLIKKQTRNREEKQKETGKVKKCAVESGTNQSSCEIYCDIIKATLDETMPSSVRYTEGCEATSIGGENVNFLRATCDRSRLPFKYSTPTKQWLNRCQSTRDKPREDFFNPMNISKLQIPKWRVGIHNT